MSATTRTFFFGLLSGFLGLIAVVLFFELHPPWLGPLLEMVGSDEASLADLLLYIKIEDMLLPAFAVLTIFLPWNFVPTADGKIIPIEEAQNSYNGPGLFGWSLTFAIMPIALAIFL